MSTRTTMSTASARPRPTSWAAVAKRRLSRLSAAHWAVIGIIGLFVLAHLHGITAAPLDTQAWRQADTSAVARNFQEESANILYPRIDMRQNYSGITGMEFPLYNYLIFLSNAALGFTYWHGRIFTLLFAAISLWLFYGTLSRRYSQRLAAIATAVMATTPLYFVFAKNIQPDMLMLMLALAAVYWTQRFTASDKPAHIHAAIAFLSLALLVKIPIIFIGLPILYILGIPRLRKLIVQPRVLGFFAVFLVLPVAFWYHHSAYLSAHFGLGQYFYGDISIKQSLQIAAHTSFWHTIVQYVLPMSFPRDLLYGALALGGVVTLVRKRYLGWVWLIAFLLFMGAFAIKSLYHDYYSLPLVPPFALLIAWGLDWLYEKLRQDSRRLALVCAAIACLAVVGTYYKQAKGLYAPQYSTEYLQLDSLMDRFSSRQQLVATNGAGTPIMLYFAHRKGWSLNPDQFTTPQLGTIRNLGARYLIIDRTAARAPAEQRSAAVTALPKLYQDTDIAVYKL